jgi:hypothetical protein
VSSPIAQIENNDMQEAYWELHAWHLRLHKEFDEAFASTQSPERPDYAWANEFLLKARREMAK